MTAFPVPSCPSGPGAISAVGTYIDDEIIATAAILRAKAMPVTLLTAALEQCGSAQHLLTSARSGNGILPGGKSVELITRELLARCAIELDTWRARGLCVATPATPNYPSNLLQVYDRPPLLFIRGNVDAAVARFAIAIVGTRTASDDGKRRAERLAAALARAGIVVTSGLAVGIDVHAHAATVRAGGCTVAVVGHGLDHMYPTQHRAAADEIVAQGGAVVSQFFPEMRPARYTFPMRNITMSGMTIATVVIEAGETSGAKMQAEAALKHGRSVFLPTSLVESHAWATRMVTDGIHGRQAFQIGSPDDLIMAFEVQHETAEPAAM